MATTATATPLGRSAVESGSDSRDPLGEVLSLLESVAYEDGLTCAMELVEQGLVGVPDTLVQLAMVNLLAGEVAARMQSDAPFEVGEAERFFLPARADVTSGEFGSGPDAGVEQMAEVAAVAHTVANKIGAVRACAVAEYARWDDPPGLHLAPAIRYPIGHVSVASAEEFAVRLQLGTFEAQTLVQESAWLTARVPRVLARVGSGETNLATAATIGRELQDARPESCERVEDAVLAREVDQRPRSVARRSTRVLLERVEAGAARVTARAAARHQVGVWLDSHSTPGLAQVSATMPIVDAEALVAAVEARAQADLYTAPAGDDVLMGERRVAALMSMALRNVTLVVNLDIVGPKSAEAPAVSGRDAALPAPMSVPARGIASARRRTVEATQVAQLVRDVPVVLTRSGAAPTAQLLRLMSDGRVRVMVNASGTESTESDERVGALLRTTDSRTAVSPPVMSTPNYRPTEGLRDLIMRRDGRCRFPGCSRNGRFTDLDHVIPWPRGRTDDQNLMCLCRRHHRAKHACWQVVMDPGGDARWISPRGAATVTTPQLREDLEDLAFVGDRERAVAPDR